MRKLLAGPLPLLGVLTLALALRVWGLTWGLPSATHYFSYHPDESVVLGYASSMSVFGGRLLPHFYNYGSLQLYLVCFANTLAALAGSVDIVPKAMEAWYPEWAKMYLIGRLLTVGMGVGTVWVVYAIGLRLWGRRAGLLAALTLAVMPLHVQHSHFLTVDVPATFWATLSLLWAVRLAITLREGRDAEGGGTPPLQAALVAGVCAGLAAATKYNLALAILPVLAACMGPTSLLDNKLLRRGPPGAEGLRGSEGKQATEGRQRQGQPLHSSLSHFGVGCSCARVAACGGVGFLLAFFAACPGAMLENKLFLDALHYESVHVQNGDDPTFHDTGNGFVYHITHNLDAGLGLPLLLTALMSIGWAVYRRERGDGLLAAFALPYYVLIGLASVRYARYVIPLLPISALWVGRMLAEGLRLQRPVGQRLVAAAAALVLFITVTNSVSLVSAMVWTDTRDQALAWLSSVPSAKRIGFAVQPWFGSPPVSPYFSMPKPGGWQRVTPPDIQRRIAYSGKDWDIDALKAQRPDVVVLSEYDYNDALRLHNPDAIAYIAELRREYTAFVEFPPLYSHIPSHLAPMPSSNLPHDMTYPSPDIVICTRGNRRLF